MSMISTGATGADGTGASRGTPPVTVHTVTCAVVLCASCGQACHHHGVPHFLDLPATRSQLAGWDWTDPDRPVCSRCTVAALCAQHGHRWGVWRDCACGGRLLEHAAGCRRLRWCAREHAGATCGVLQAGDRKPAAAT